jgi:hypothetical protein
MNYIQLNTNIFETNFLNILIIILSFFYFFNIYIKPILFLYKNNINLIYNKTQIKIFNLILNHFYIKNIFSFYIIFFEYFLFFFQNLNKNLKELFFLNKFNTIIFLLLKKKILIYNETKLYNLLIKKNSYLNLLKLVKFFLL